VRIERLWRELSRPRTGAVIGWAALAYQDEVPVNWSPGWGRFWPMKRSSMQERSGRLPVERRPSAAGMLRITAYADRLVKDLDLLDWP